MQISSLYFRHYSTKCLAQIIILIIYLISLITPALAKEEAKPILFIPQDNRPISSSQSSELLTSLGYKVETPPANLLGDRYNLAQRDKLFAWLEEHGGENKIAIIASDSLIYGGLVNSRKHEFTLEALQPQLKKIVELRKKFPTMPIYVFSSIMRTPRNGAASGTEDADYYKKYGALIADYTKIDGADTSSLSKPYQVMLRQEETQRALSNWQKRREINFKINKELINLTKNGTITYLLIGRDDNDTGSMTDQESTTLENYAKNLGLKQHQIKIIAGIDELASLLMARIGNTLINKTPKVYVEYALGYGPATVPTYSNEAIDSTITNEIYTSNARRVFSPQEADLVFLINTNQSGWTYDANTPVNSTKLRFNSANFLQKILHYIQMKKHVAIGDIAFANGSDNALMEELANAKALDKLYGYAGWNTATNSTGFALSMGLIALNLDAEQRRKLLATRYLDDWLYQANVRQDINGYLSLLPGKGNYLDVGREKLEPIETYGSRRLNSLVKEYLPTFNLPQNIKLTLPWNRIFEGNFHQPTNYRILEWH